MAVPIWQPGTLYSPGDVVRPTLAGDVTQDDPENPGFEGGDTGWTWANGHQFGGGSGTIDQIGPTFEGTWSARAGFTDNLNGTSKLLTNNRRLPIKPGDPIGAKAFVFGPDAVGQAGRVQFRIKFFSAAMAPVGVPIELAHDPTDMAGEPRVNAAGLVQYACRNIWLPLELDGVAPPGAAWFTVEFQFFWGDMPFIVDSVSVDYAVQDPSLTLLFRAVQAAAGFSGGTEPDWPDTLGLTVVDNEVTWEAIAGNTITWEANRILVSGPTEPAWPLGAGASVPDNTIAWVLDPRRVSDEGVPSSTIALIASSKVFSPDGDIIDFSATVNPLDWSTPEDAGYLPFGLQNYGANPIEAMGLYRGNVVAFNSQGAQIWQVDEDPAAMNLLDAIPVSCVFAKSVQPVGDDLAFLSSLGIRSLGLVGASINLQGGYFGKQVDSLVVAEIAKLVANGWTPRGIYWPARGQYWLFFGPQAFVLTINGPAAGQRSWSRYVLPATVDAWALMGDALHLRAGNLVWRVDPTAQLDDLHDEAGLMVGTEFASVIQWPHLDFGSFNVDKEMVGFDLAIDGSCVMSVGYDQREQDYDPDGAWTEGYAVPEDSVPGQMLPYSLTGASLALRLEFRSTQRWKWYSSNLYVKDMR